MVISEAILCQSSLQATTAVWLSRLSRGNLSIEGMGHMPLPVELVNLPLTEVIRIVGTWEALGGIPAYLITEFITYFYIQTFFPLWHSWQYTGSPMGV